MRVLTISRVVAFATPIFAGLAGWLTAAAAKYLPGAPVLDAGELTVFFVVGATTAAAAAVTWLSNRGKHERQVRDEQAELELEAREDRRASAAGFENALQMAHVKPAAPAGLEVDMARMLAHLNAVAERMEAIEARLSEIPGTGLAEGRR